MLAAAGDFGLSYILEIVALVIVAWFVWKYVWAGGLSLRSMMDRRAEAIRNQLAAGDEARAQTEALLASRRSELEAARAEAATIVSQATDAAADVVTEGRRRAEEDYQRLLQRAEVEAEGVLARVRAEVAAEAGALIVAAVERVIEGELDASSHHRLIAEAITATEAEEV